MSDRDCNIYMKWLLLVLNTKEIDCDCTAALCNIAQWRQDFGHPTFAAFVDLRAAFDCLSRPTLWLLLIKLGIPDKTVRLFRVLYDNSASCVWTGGTHSSWFKIEAGVRRGCVLAPLICHRHGLVTGQDCWILLDWCGVWPELLHWSGFCWRCLSPCWTARASCSIGSTCDISCRSSITRAAMQSLENQIWRSRLAISTKQQIWLRTVSVTPHFTQ